HVAVTRGDVRRMVQAASIELGAPRPRGVLQDARRREAADRRMTGRREFLLFVGCALMPQAHAQVRRREVRVAGRRIKTIDVHAHCVIPEAEALMKHKSAGVYAITWEERLKRLDAQGIDLQALSINPTWYGLERDLATKVIELQNERLAELCAQHRDRLVAFASVALQYPDLAAQQLEQA